MLRVGLYLLRRKAETAILFRLYSPKGRATVPTALDLRTVVEWHRMARVKEHVICSLTF